MVVAKSVILGISPLPLLILALRSVVVAKSVILGISPLPLLILALRAVVVATLGNLSSISLIL